MRLFIEPSESLLFRTGRPFVAGENNYAETMFPPTPETLQGAIRATIAAYWQPGVTIAEAFAPKSNGEDNDLVKLIGKFQDYRRFRITGISLGCRTNMANSTIERLFPAPAHILEAEGDETTQVRLVLKSCKDANVLTNLPDGMDLLYPEHISTDSDKLEPIKGWLTESELKKALNLGSQTTPGQALVTVTKDKDIYTRESRLGIGMNNKTKATQEGLLYQVEMIRMNPDYGFVVDIALASEQDEKTLIDDKETQTLLHLPDYGFMSIGGERRAARFEVITSQEPSQLEQNKEGNMLYLATPAALNYGWQPENWKNKGLEAPIAVAIERYQPIGGWLLQPQNTGGNDKPLRRCVPAGTVYYFKDNIRIPSTLTDYGQQIGYGIAYAGHTGVN